MYRKHFKGLVGGEYQKNGWKGYDYDFSFDDDAAAFSKILDTEKFFRK